MHIRLHLPPLRRSSPSTTLTSPTLTFRSRKACSSSGTPGSTSSPLDAWLLCDCTYSTMTLLACSILSRTAPSSRPLCFITSTITLTSVEPWCCDRYTRKNTHTHTHTHIHIRVRARVRLRIESASVAEKNRSKKTSGAAGAACDRSIDQSINRSTGSPPYINLVDVRLDPVHDLKRPGERILVHPIAVCAHGADQGAVDVEGAQRAGGRGLLIGHGCARGLRSDAKRMAMVTMRMTMSSTSPWRWRC